MSKLADVFTQTVNEIKTSIGCKLAEKRTSIQEGYLKKRPKIDGKQELIKKKEEAISILQQEIQQLQTEIKNLDPKITSKEAQRLYNELGGVGDPKYGCWNRKKSEVVIDAKMSKTKEYTNYEARKKIHAQVRAQFNLCIKDSERQSVILKLQNGIDWKALGINIPNLFDIKKVTIADGTIIINNDLPNKKVK